MDCVYYVRIGFNRYEYDYAVLNNFNTTMEGNDLSAFP